MHPDAGVVPEVPVVGVVVVHQHQEDSGTVGGKWVPRLGGQRQTLKGGDVRLEKQFEKILNTWEIYIAAKIGIYVGETLLYM